MFSLAIKQVLAQRLRLALTSLAVVLGVTFVSGTLILTDTSQQLFDERFTSQSAETDVTVRTDVAFDAAMGVEVERDPVPASLLDSIEDAAGVDAAVGVITGTGLVMVDQEPVTSAGPSMLQSWAPAPFGGFTIAEGTNPRGPDEVVLDSRTAKAAGLRIGDQVSLQADTVDRFRVVGLARPTTEGAFADSTIMLVGTDAARSLLQLGDGFTEIRVTADADTSTADLERTLAATVGDKYAVTSSKDIADASADAARSQLNFLQLALLGLAGAALLVGAYLIANTFTIVIAQRTRELALLRAAGATGGQLFRLLIGEVLMIGLVGSGVGTVLGIGTAQGLRAILYEFGLTLPTGSIVIRPTSMMIAFGTGVVITLLAGLLPARRAANVSALAAMRSSAATSAMSRGRLLTGIVSAVATAAAAAALLTNAGSITLVATAAVTAIVALTALGPLIAGPLARLATIPLRAAGVPGRLAGEFAARTPRRTAATVLGLTLSLTLVTFMTALGASIKGSIATSYQEAITADLVIESAGGEMLGGLSPAVYDRLRELPEVQVASRVRFGHWKKGSMTTALTAVDPDTAKDVAVIRLHAGSMTDLREGGVVISEKVADTDGLKVGDTLEMTFPRDGEQAVPVVGIFDNDLIQAVQTDYLVSLTTYKRHFAENVDASVFLTLAPGVDGESARRTISKALVDFPTAEIRDQDAAVDSRTQVVEQILGLVTVLLMFTVGIAMLSITNTLALSIVERTREIGLLRAIGMTVRQLRRMVRLEAVLLAAVAVILGVVLGGGFAGLTTRVLGTEGAMGLVLPTTQIAALVVATSLAGLVAGMLPARRAARLRMLEAIGSA